MTKNAFNPGACPDCQGPIQKEGDQRKSYLTYVFYRMVPTNCTDVKRAKGIYFFYISLLKIHLYCRVFPMGCLALLATLQK